LCLGSTDGYYDTTWAGSGKIAFHNWVPGNNDSWSATRVALEGNGNLLLVGSGLGTNKYFWLGELSGEGQFIATFGVSNGSGLTTSNDLLAISGVDLPPTGFALAPGGGYWVLAGTSDAIVLEQTTAQAHASTGLNFRPSVFQVNNVKGSVSAYSALALQPDGKLLAGGYGFATEVDTTQKLGIVRFNSGLDLDAGFNATTIGGVEYAGGNVIQAAPDGFGAVVTDIMVLADGHILVVGTGGASGGRKIELARLNADGTLDSTFGTGGVTALSPAPSVGSIDAVNFGSATVDRAGRILITASLSDPFPADMPVLLVARVTGDGALDTTFHGTGYAVFSLAATCAGSGGIFASALAIDSAGRILAAGTCNVSDIGSDFLVVRFRGDGYLDGSFGINGYSLGAFVAGNLGNQGNAIVLDAGGRPVIAGDTTETGVLSAGVARLTYDLIRTNDFEAVPRGCLPPDCP
jgi:uncharacterized delta-60 repeat protein